jgi:rSAM/selenodomain-associated transferase 2
MNKGISIIIPVWNEASIINRAIEHIVSLPSAEEIEVIVVDGDPHGGSIHAIRRKGVTRVVSEKGRAQQMNRGASHAQGEILLFLHADTELPLDALRAIPIALEKPDVVAGAFDLRIQSDRVIFRVIEHAASLRSRITRIPYGDQGIFIRRDYFHTMGGFREMPLMEDVDLMRRIKRAGDTIRILPSRIKTSPRRWEREGILYCTSRNWMLITLFLFGVSAERLARYYR